MTVDAHAARGDDRREDRSRSPRGSSTCSLHFVENPHIVYTRRQLLDSVWGVGWVGDERTVDVHVRQLRRKLGDALPLTTIWGVGYRCD